MIAPSAIKKFLNRQLDDFNFLKGLPSKVVSRELTDAKVEEVIGSATKSMLHQKVCLIAGTAHRRFLFFLDMGTGKSKIALDLIQYHRTGGEVKRALVLVPNRANVQGWIDEAKKHHPNLVVKELRSAGDIKEPADVYVSLYLRVCRMICIDEAKPGGGRRWAIDPRLVKEFAGWFDALILDESTAVKNPQSLVFRTCNGISKQVSVCYALTGTPHGRNPQDLWAQFKVVDRGETLGETLGLFREAFFTKQQKMTLYKRGRQIRIFDYHLTRDKAEKLSRVIRHRSIRYETEECVTLPKKVYSRVPFVLGEGAGEQYRTIIESVYERDADEVRRTFTGMRQAVGGFAYVRPTDEEREVVEFDIVNERVEALLGVVRGIPDTAKFIVFHEFLHSGDLISKAFDKEKVGHGRIFSGTKNPEQVLKKFHDDPNCKSLVMNNQSGAFGLNLQVANYAVFYESPVSPIVRSQAEHRIHRVGQERPVFYYDLVALNSIDDRIRSMILEGKDLLDEIINGRAKL